MTVIRTHMHTHKNIQKHIDASTHLGFHACNLPNSSVPKTWGEVRGSWTIQELGSLTLKHTDETLIGGWFYRDLFPRRKGHLDGKLKKCNGWVGFYLWLCISLVKGGGKPRIHLKALFPQSYPSACTLRLALAETVWMEATGVFLCHLFVKFGLSNVLWCCYPKHCVQFALRCRKDTRVVLILKRHG